MLPLLPWDSPRIFPLSLTFCHLKIICLGVVFLEFILCTLTCFSCVQLFVTLWTVACQALLSMEFSRQEYWSLLPFASSGIFPTQGLNVGVLHCRHILYHLSHQGSLLFLSFFVLFPCDLISIFSVVFAFLFCMCIYYRYFVCDSEEVLV